MSKINIQRKIVSTKLYAKTLYILHLQKDYPSITSDYHNEVDYLYKTVLIYLIKYVLW